MADIFDQAASQKSSADIFDHAALLPYTEANAAANPPVAKFSPPTAVEPSPIRAAMQASPTVQAINKAAAPVTDPINKFLSSPRGKQTMMATGMAGGGVVSDAAEALPATLEALKPPTQSIVPAARQKPLLQHVVQQLTGTTPERISELSQVEDKVAQAHDIAVQTEATAKAAAKSAFPDIQTPVELPPKYSVGGWHGDHFVTADELKPQQIPFKQAQEQYSQLALDARAAHIARLRGMATGFDEQAILQKKNEIGTAMQAAADAEGKLPQLQAAKQGFAQFMNDFHNKGSAIEPLLEMKPDETSKIVGHFLSPDKGTRSIETLQQYGGDVSPIQDLLAKGATPLKIDVNEAAKLRKVGLEGYGPLRLQESIDQAQFNRLPSSAQARLPAAAMKQSTKIPYIPESISPSIPTRYLTKKLLLSDLARKAVSGE